jgi:SAM-dependent methyltransferase
MSAIAWYKTYFGEDYLHAYSWYLTPERTTQEVEGIRSLLGLEPANSILDLCCGHGRHAIPLARHGYQVTGLDLSTMYLDKARAEADSQNVQVRWIHSDMREIPFENEFDSVINIFSAFGYLENDDEDKKVLYQVYKALKPGGKFLIETGHRDAYILHQMRRRRVFRQLDNGKIVLLKRHFDPLMGREYGTFIIISPTGERSEITYEERVYTVTELIQMLTSVGLRFLACYSDCKGHDLDLEQPENGMVIISQKL